jgi:WD40 repeat protein
LTAGGDEANLWNLKTGQPGMRFARQGSVASAQFSPDGRWVVTGSWDTTAKIWDAETGLVQRRLAGHTGFVNDVVFSPRDTASRRPATTAPRALGRRDRTGTDPLHRASGSSPQRGLFARWPTCSDRVQRQNRAYLGYRNGPQVQELTAHDQAVLCAAYSADGRHVITGGEDNQALVWDVTGDQPASPHSSKVTRPP